MTNVTGKLNPLNKRRVEKNGLDYEQKFLGLLGVVTWTIVCRGNVLRQCSGWQNLAQMEQSSHLNQMQSP